MPNPAIAGTWNESALELKGLVSVNRDTFHVPLRCPVVGADAMLRAAIVPHRDRVRLPTETATEIRRFDMTIEELQQRRALTRFHVLERSCESGIDKQSFAPTF